MINGHGKFAAIDILEPPDRLVNPFDRVRVQDPNDPRKNKTELAESVEEIRRRCRQIFVANNIQNFIIVADLAYNFSAHEMVSTNSNLLSL
jgi:flagellar biosynthesis/type III secretory pathway chaperone